MPLEVDTSIRWRKIDLKMKIYLAQNLFQKLVRVNEEKVTIAYCSHLCTKVGFELSTANLLYELKTICYVCCCKCKSVSVTAVTQYQKHSLSLSASFIF